MQPPPSPGFVGYLVNLARLTPEQLAVKLSVTRRNSGPGGAGPGRGGGGRGRGPTQQLEKLGLRRTALFQLFRNAMMFTTRDAMLAHNAAHGASGGLYCLEDNSSVNSGGVRYGAGARAYAGEGVRAGVAPVAEWRDSPLRADARTVAAHAAAAEAEVAATANVVRLTALRDAAKNELAAARTAAPRAPVDAPGGARPRQDVPVPEAKRARRH